MGAVWGESLNSPRRRIDSERVSAQRSCVGSETINDQQSDVSCLRLQVLRREVLRLQVLRLQVLRREVTSSLKKFSVLPPFLRGWEGKGTLNRLSGVRVPGCSWPVASTPSQIWVHKNSQTIHQTVTSEAIWKPLLIQKSTPAPGYRGFGCKKN